jgi:hypothetical protein
VTVDGGRVQAGAVSVDLAGARTWQGALPTGDELVAGAGLAIDVLVEARPSALGDAAFAARLGRAVADIGGGRLLMAVEALAGLGPGLTPAGDDVLAGVLLVARARGGQAAEPALVHAAAAARTNDVARAFLAWAARGQSIAPVHDLLTAAVTGNRAGATSALCRLLAVGHSSGADLAFGLRLGLSVGLRFAVATTA